VSVEPTNVFETRPLPRKGKIVQAFGPVAHVKLVRVNGVKKAESEKVKARKGLLVPDRKTEMGLGLVMERMRPLAVKFALTPKSRSKLL
jgi:hypothetical protein